LLACATASGSAQSRARVVTLPPDALTLATNLSPQDRRSNFEALWKAIDTTYAGFALKHIDWKDIGRRYRARLTDVTTDDAFYRLLGQMVTELRDTHSWLQNYRDPPLLQVTSIAVDLLEGNPFVVAVRPGSDADQAGVKPGSQILNVDGVTAAKRMEALRPLLHGFSSERAFERDATRHLLAAEQSVPAKLFMREPNGDLLAATLAREPGPTTRRPELRPGFEITRRTNLEFGIHPSGAGYIRIPSFEPRAELDADFDAALDALRNTPGLIIDLRDNTGGYSHPAMVGRFFDRRTKTTVSFIKSGPGHGTFRKQPGFDAPTGPWQYTRPVVLLVNDLTGSAADLFVAELGTSKRVTVVGTTTHGNVSGTAVYAVLPCNLVVRISNGYVTDARGRAIEENGNAPDISVAPTLADLLAGRDRALEKAAAVLHGKASSKPRGLRSNDHDRGLLVM